MHFKPWNLERMATPTHWAVHTHFLIHTNWTRLCSQHIMSIKNVITHVLYQCLFASFQSVQGVARNIAENGWHFPGNILHIFCLKKSTRQHSTQSVGNMPPPSPPHLLPQVLQIMPRNPKYDQFQPKGHHNEENPQSTTKMPGNPKFYPFH